MKNKQSIYKLIFTFSILAIVFFLLQTGKITCDFSQENFTVNTGFAGSKTILYEDIVQVQLMEKWEKGNRKFGVSTFKISAGNFSNSQSGDYFLAIYDATPLYIYLSTEEELLVFNAATAQQTNQVYSTILQNLSRPVPKV